MDVTELIKKFNKELENELPGYRVNQLILGESGNRELNPEFTKATTLCWKWDSSLGRYVPC